MAKSRTVVQVERLRDQVYRLIRDDLKAGELEPGQRIVEGELAGRYRVSRTPVREALLQLSQDGLLTAAPDRGYAVVIDSQAANAQRHEVRDLIDPLLARRAARDGSAEQKRALVRAHERQAQAADDEAAFVEANEAFRERLRAMCANTFLAQCCALVEDQAQWARRTAFRRPDNRALEVEHDGRLAAAIASGDADAAEAAMRAYVEAVRKAP